MEENNNLEQQPEATPAQDYVEPTETAQAEAPQQSDADRNFAQLRQQKEQLEREREEMRKRMAEMEASQSQPKESKTQTPQLADDDLVEWKYVRQEIDGLKNEIKSYQQNSATAAAETRLKARFTDFDSVVNQQNIEKLRQQYPEIAATLAANNDLYTQASAAYNIIKQYGIGVDPYKEDKEKVQSNAQKPRSLNNAGGQRGESPLDNASAFADGLTPELKDKLRREMEDAIKRR
jgi:hypothetical protein